MKLFLKALLLVWAFGTLEARINGKQYFCQKHRCLTCVRNYCTTTCRGLDCAKCPIGDCCNKNDTECNICRGERCCTDVECNNCVVTCLTGCEGSPTCHPDCFDKCVPEIPEDNHHHQDLKPIYRPVNVSTFINITNTLNNTNSVQTPVVINGLPQQHPERSYSQKVNIDTTNCCELVHPRECKEHSNGQTVCYTAKHTECSEEICTGGTKHVHIVETHDDAQSCIEISERPFLYCNYYLVENCDRCYCSDKDCTQEPGCSETCRNSILPEDQYNKLLEQDSDL